MFDDEKNDPYKEVSEIPPAKPSQDDYRADWGGGKPAMNQINQDEGE